MKENTKVCLLHTNDTHSYLDDFDRRASLVNDIRKKNQQIDVDTFLFDSGDVYSGNIYFNLYDGQKEAQFMSMLGYDGMTFGNHEFDRGSETIARFIQKINFPIISANVDVAQDTYLSPFIGNKIIPYELKTLGNGDKIAIFGLTTETTVDSASPSVETMFNAPLEIAEAMVQYFQQSGINKIILLSHLGDEQDVKLAQEVAGISVILGAHTHVLIEEPVKVHHHEENWQTFIVQAENYGKYLGELTIEFKGQTSEILVINETLHVIAEYPKQDRRFTKKINEMKKEKSVIINQVICKTSSELNGLRKHLQHGSTNLGNLIADSYYEAAKGIGYDVDLAIMNSGGIRNSIQSGIVMYGDLIEVLPFAMQVDVLEVTGEELLQAFKQGQYPQVSHAKVIYTVDGENQVSLKELLLLKKGKYIPVAKNQRYRVATNSFVSVGKDDYRSFKEALVLGSTEKVDVDLLADFMHKLPQPVEYSTEQRVVYE